MPLYDYECGKCNSIVEVYLKLDKIDEIQKCSKCNSHLTRLISHMRKPTIWGYYSEAMDRWIGSAEDKRRGLNELNLYEKC